MGLKYCLDVVNHQAGREKLRRIAAQLLARMPGTALDYLDAIFQEAQGKGWGYAGVAREIAALKILLDGKRSRKETIIFDVGAHVGDWTSEVLKAWPLSEVTCFEPSTSSAGALRRRFASDTRVRIIQAAVGECDGEATLFANHSGSELGSLRSRRLDHFETSLSTTETVKLLSLDSYIKDCSSDLSVDILKVDAEGYEMEVLSGAQDCLQRVKAVQFEWGEASTGSPIHWVDFWYFFRDRGMNLYRVSPRGVIAVNRYHPRDEVMTWTNYIAVRADRN